MGYYIFNKVLNLTQKERNRKSATSYMFFLLSKLAEVKKWKQMEKGVHSGILLVNINWCYIHGEYISFLQLM